MSEKNKKDFPMGISSKDPLVVTNNSCNKHGVIKGNNKKETKNLRNMCFHHKLNKKNHKKPAVSNDGAGMCTCYMCTHKFPAHLYEKDDVKKIYLKFRGMLDQAKYMTAAADLGKNTVTFLTQLSVLSGMFPSTYKKIRKVVEKADKTKKKKNKSNRNGGVSTENYGGWR